MGVCLELEEAKLRSDIWDFFFHLNMDFGIGFVGANDDMDIMDLRYTRHRSW